MDEDIDNNSEITTTNTLINPTGNYPDLSQVKAGF